MLSNIIGLDSDHYGNWLGVKFGGIPKTEIEEINPGQTFLIPNTVIAAWGGNCGGMGKLYVSWDFNINYLNDLGFHVDEINYSGNKIEENSLGVFLEKSTKDKVVHGLYFWGHGNTTALYNAQDGRLVRNGNLKLAYKLAACFIFACESNSQKSMLSSGSPGSIWFGTPVGEIYKPYPNRVPEFLLEIANTHTQEGSILLLNLNQATRRRLMLGCGAYQPKVDESIARKRNIRLWFTAPLGNPRLQSREIQPELARNKRNPVGSCCAGGQIPKPLRNPAFATSLPAPTIKRKPHLIELRRRVHFPIHHWSPPIVGNQGKPRAYQISRTLAERTPTSFTKYVWDGWHLLAELNGKNNDAALVTYTWGPDLSGTFGGAGGVGGLLGISKKTVPTVNLACLYDGNGNITQLVDIATGDWP